jgi:filamentous hemagglutinin family protein
MYAILYRIGFAKHRGDRPVGSFFRLSPLAAALVALGTVGLSAPAGAAPTGGQISAGAGSISSVANGAGGTRTVIQQNSNRLAINWAGFDIGAKDSVTFAQPNSGAIALNRITGQNPTQILGALNANGQVFILNPNGVLFGKTAQVNVGGLLASTLNLSDSDFLAGRYRFTDSGGTGTIVNEGQISSPGGYIAFIAPQVSNQGQLLADGGTVELAAGAAATVTLASNRLVSLTIDEGTLDALAQNGDLIRADGGLVILTSKGQDAVLSGVVNNTGVIQARTAATGANGTIRLLADGGTTTAGGTLDASAPNGGDGGLIETSGQVFKLLPGTTITTLAAQGKTGMWLVDPLDITVAATGGDLTGAELSAELATTDVTLSTSTGSLGTPGSGIILIHDAVSWSSGSTLTLDADDAIEIEGVIDAGVTGSILATAANNLTVSAPVTGSSVTLDSGGQIVVDQTLTANTLSLSAGGGVTINSSLVAGTGGLLTLSAGNIINVSPDAAIETGSFILGGGNWIQVGAGSLAGFSASFDFEILGGASFLRALNGAGTATNPYLVSDVFSLQGIGSSAALLADSYQLSSSFTAGGTGTWNGGSGFVPIGTAAAPFTGSLNGGGMTIDALFIDRPGTDGVGLFGAISDGLVANLTLTGVSITGSVDVGALAGENIGGRVQAVNVLSGSVAATDDTLTAMSDGTDLGGLVGHNLDSSTEAEITLSSVAAGVTVGLSNPSDTGSRKVGGLVGSNDGSILLSNAAANVAGDADVGGIAGGSTNLVQFSYASGNVTGTTSAGGLVGTNQGVVDESFAAGSTVATAGDAGGLVGQNEATGQITNSYALGPVSGAVAGGGLVGNNLGSIATSFAAGLVQQPGGAVGGLVGTGTGAVANSYWNLDTSGVATSAGGSGLSNAQMLDDQGASFNGFNFSAIWSFIPGVSYPYLLPIFVSRPGVVSGNYSSTSGTPLGGANVDLAANGEVIANSTTGANGFYYMMLPSTVASSTTSVAAFLTSGGDALGVAETNDGSVSLNLQQNTVTDGGTVFTLADVTSTLGQSGVGPLAGLVAPELAQWSSNALTTANGIALNFGTGTQFNLSGSSNSLSATGITLGLVDGAGTTLTLNAGTGNIGQTGGFIVSGLEIASGDNVTLNAGNEIDTLSANVTGSLSVNEATNLAITQVGATVGIEAGGTVSLNVPGRGITLDQAITANGDGDAVVLASNDFTNLAGADAIVTNNGNWLVYSNSPSNDVFGSATLGTLASGNLGVWGVNYNPATPATASGDRYIFAADQAVLVSTVANQKVAGTTAEDSATLLLEFAGATYGNAFTDSVANLPAGLVISASSAGDAASADPANGDDGTGRFKIGFTISGAPAGYQFLTGTLADLEVDPAAPPPVSPPPAGVSAASSNDASIVDSVLAATESDTASNTDRDDGSLTKNRATWLAGTLAPRTSDVRYEQHSSNVPAWPTSNACTP